MLSDAYNSDKFSINIKQQLYITKKKSEADFVVSIGPASDTRIAMVKDLKDPSDTHKYSFNSVIAAVEERMKRENIKIDYPSGFNQYVLQLIIDFYDVKREPRFAYEHKIGNQRQYTYSQQFIDFVIDEMKKVPNNFVCSLKKAKKR